MPALTPGRVAALTLLITLPWCATAAGAGKTGSGGGENVTSAGAGEGAGEGAGVGAAEGEWKCTQAADTGKWSCSRDGMSAAELAGPTDAGASTTAESVAESVTRAGGVQTETAPAEVAPAEVAPTTATPSETAAAPTEIDPYEARARAASEYIIPPADTEPESTALVEEPVAPATLPAGEPVADPAPEPVTYRDPEPQPPAAEPPADQPPAAEPIGQSAPVDTSNLPDYQRLAYVPDKPTSLLELPAHFWVAQLMAVSSKEFLESYAQEHNLRGLSAARIASGDRLFFVLILGIYDTKEKAEQAITDMPPPYHTYKPLLRTLGSLQDAMRKADQMTGSSDF